MLRGETMTCRVTASLPGYGFSELCSQFRCRGTASFSTYWVGPIHRENERKWKRTEYYENSNGKKNKICRSHVFSIFSMLFENNNTYAELSSLSTKCPSPRNEQNNPNSPRSLSQISDRQGGLTFCRRISQLISHLNATPHKRPPRSI